MSKKVISYAAHAAHTPLSLFHIERRDLESHDVQIEILFCGVCHTDLHTVNNEWKTTLYPVVPGHEIVGRVSAVGIAVKSFKVGDFAAVGCLADSCRSCFNCSNHLEQYCEKETIWTYNSLDKHSGEITYGGYSTHIVMNEKFVLHLPSQFKESDFASVAPLLCAGITTYSPLRHWKISKGSQVGIVGLGGLGHMGIKIAHALGAHVTLFTTSSHKIEDAKRLGASEVVLSQHVDTVKKYANQFDFILDTVAASHNLDMYLELLKTDGVLCLVGVPEFPHPSPSAGSLINRRRSLVGSMIGGIQETQEMLNFCAEHGITADVEVIPIQKINEAYKRMLKSDVRYRFVIDMSSLKKMHGNHGNKSKG